MAAADLAQPTATFLDSSPAGPDVALSIGGFPLQFPAEAHLTAEGRVRLPDGREFTDLVAAAAAATGLGI
ncbi:hypothetical protein BJ973_005646 [Actinoplanes tereljensis]|uniref:hypothetical protein n=1 Tax=Paractinoplanes tereljensis TaxID=571912 RepID=UPI0019452BB6|nr:hypothetical protein [Actinoplanes tereljensis]